MHRPKPVWANEHKEINKAQCTEQIEADPTTFYLCQANPSWMRQYFLAFYGKVSLGSSSQSSRKLKPEKAPLLDTYLGWWEVARGLGGALLVCFLHYFYTFISSTFSVVSLN